MQVLDQAPPEQDNDQVVNEPVDDAQLDDVLPGDAQLDDVLLDDLHTDADTDAAETDQGAVGARSTDAGVASGRVVTRGYDIDLAPSEVLATRAMHGWRALLGMGPSPAARRDLDLKRAMNVNFGRPVNIVLANPRGYAGKTSLTLGLAGSLGRARAGGVKYRV